MTMPTTRKWTDMMETAGPEVSNEVLPAGTYDLIVSKVDQKQTSTGKDMFVLVMEVETGPHAKRRLWNNMVVSPDSPTAMGIFFRQMAALGLDRRFFATEPTNDAIAAALQNRRARGTVSIKKYQGRDRNEVSNLNPPNTSSLPPGVPVTAAAPPAPPTAPPPPPPVAAVRQPPPPATPPAAPPAPAPAAAPAAAASPPPPPPPPAEPASVPAPAPSSNGGGLEDPPF